MLKYSFMTFACPQYAIEQVIAAAARHGYDGVEPRVAEGHTHGIELERTPAERAAIRRQFEDADIEVACIATSVRLNRPTPAERTAMVEQAKAYCELASDVGARRIRVFGGHAEDQPGRATAIGRVREGLAACAETAGAAGVFVCLETHDYFSAGADVTETVTAAGSPWIGATWDTQHTVTAGEDVAFTESMLMPLVHHVHFHDCVRSGGKNTIVPIGEGGEPIAELLAVFQKHTYTGFISGEWFYNNGPEKDLAHFISALKALETV